jgi:uncharacterized membrane protein
MDSRVKFFDHPLHPLLVHFPIALLDSADGAALTVPMEPFFLSLIGVICLAISGALGSQLVFKHQVGVVAAESELPVKAFAKSGRM